jgi:diamine N-acetyltransferase
MRQNKAFDLTINIIFANGMLKGKAIFLRALEPSDIDNLYDWENDPEVWNISDTQVPFSRYQLEQYIASSHDIHVHHQIRFVICRTDTSNAIGFIDLFDYSVVHNRLGCGILIASKADYNKGFATESIELIKEYCFGILDCHQIYCNILHDNKASIGLFEKCGFERIGEKKDWIRINGEYHNELTYQCINK